MSIRQITFFILQFALDLLPNYTCLLKLPFLASFNPNFSARWSKMAEKFRLKAAQKSSIFPSKANYARGLNLE